MSPMERFDKLLFQFLYVGAWATLIMAGILAIFG